jgi:uncharacterized protein
LPTAYRGFTLFGTRILFPCIEGAAMNRRDLLRTTAGAAAALGLSRFPLGWGDEPNSPKRRILMFTRSEGFEHPVVQRKKGQLSLAERIVTDLGKQHNFEVNCQKDGRVFVNEDLSKYHAFLFESQGNLSSEKSLDGAPAMPPEGKKALLDAVAGGKGFVGCHCASDTFHSAGYPKNRWESQKPDQIDSYIAMVGGEFAGHGDQQDGWMRVVDTAFPGAKGLEDFKLKEEWYSLKNFAPDLHVILVQDTEGMKNFDYERPKFPATWARRHHKGRVFYTSMGHREDVWENKTFQQLLLGGLAWATGNVKAEVPANIAKVAPHASELPKSKK